MAKLRPTHLALFVAVLYLAYTAWALNSPLAWVTLGERFADDDLPLYSVEGYDGQFTYAIARAPLCPADYIDVPAYRCQRVLLPLMAWGLSLGQIEAIPFMLVAVNLAGLALGVWSMEQLLIVHRVSRWTALGYGLAFGVLGGVRLSLPEPLAYGLALFGLLLVERKHILWSAPVFVLATLSKETALLIPASVGLYLLFSRQVRTAIGFGLAVLVPFGLWQLMLYHMTGAMGIGSGGAGATGFEIIPYMGVVRILLTGGPTVFALIMAIVGPFVLWPTLWGLWRIWRDLHVRRWTLGTALLLVNAGIMLFVPFSTYREITGILRFVVGLHLAIVLYAAERRHLPALHYSTLWAVASIILIYSDVMMT